MAEKTVAKEKSSAAGSLWHELFLETGLYKRSQGKITRQVTFAALAATFVLGAWSLYQTYSTSESLLMKYAVPGLIAVAGVWLSFRLVNLPRFADFLIAVEAEMNKVSWPTRQEIIRSSIVVIVLIFFLAIILFGFDVFWMWLFRLIGVLHGKGKE
jgi:preprotein translocase subunit SecE